jgi:hypothetical protein
MANRRTMPYDFDRERGIFTPRDRRFLAGELDDELSETARRQKRYRLRKRTYHALQDLAFLEEMETRDLFHIAEGVSGSDSENYFTVTSAADEDQFREIVRTRQGLKSMISLYREMFTPSLFAALVEDQCTIRAALDHYDETGRYGQFETSLSIDLEEEMSISELLDVEIKDPDPIRPGANAVLDQLDFSEKYALAPAVSKPILDLIDELDDGNGVSRETVVEKVSEAEDIPLSDAYDRLDKLVSVGLCRDVGTDCVEINDGS